MDESFNDRMCGATVATSTRARPTNWPKSTSEMRHYTAYLPDADESLLQSGDHVPYAINRTDMMPRTNLYPSQRTPVYGREDMTDRPRAGPATATRTPAHGQENMSFNHVIVAGGREYDGFTANHVTDRPNPQNWWDQHDGFTANHVTDRPNPQNWWDQLDVPAPPARKYTYPTLPRQQRVPKAKHVIIPRTAATVSGYASRAAVSSR